MGTDEPTAPPPGTSLHRHLVMILREAAPWGARLDKRLAALGGWDRHDPTGPDPQALALLDAVRLTPALLATVRELRDLTFEETEAVWPGFDGESEVFPLRGSMAHLTTLPNLERYVDADSCAPFDPTPLLALPGLREVGFPAAVTGFRAGRTTTTRNRRAVTILERAGFRVESTTEWGQTLMRRRGRVRRATTA